MKKSYFILSLLAALVATPSFAWDPTEIPIEVMMPPEAPDLKLAVEEYLDTYAGINKNDTVAVNNRSDDADTLASMIADLDVLPYNLTVMAITTEILRHQAEPRREAAILLLERVRGRVGEELAADKQFRKVNFMLEETFFYGTLVWGGWQLATLAKTHLPKIGLRRGVKPTGIEHKPMAPVRPQEPRQITNKPGEPIKFRQGEEFNPNHLPTTGKASGLPAHLTKKKGTAVLNVPQPQEKSISMAERYLALKQRYGRVAVSMGVGSGLAGVSLLKRTLSERRVDPRDFFQEKLVTLACDVATDAVAVKNDPKLYSRADVLVLEETATWLMGVDKSLQNMFPKAALKGRHDCEQVSLELTVRELRQALEALPAEEMKR